MLGSSTILNTLLPTKMTEQPSRGAQRKNEDTFAAVFEKRILARQEKTAFKADRTEPRDGSAAVRERQNESRPAERTEGAERPEKPSVKNPAKEKLKELMKKVRDTLEAMKDPEATPEQLKALAKDLKDQLAEIKSLVEALKESPGSESAAPADVMPALGENVHEEAAAVLPQTTGTQSAAPAEDGKENGLKIGRSEAHLQAKAEHVHWDNRQAPEMKGNPILKDLEKVLEVQAPAIAEDPGLEAALKQVLEEIRSAQGTATKPEAQFSDKVDALMTKLGALSVKVTETKPAETADKAADEAVPAVEETGVSGLTTVNAAANPQNGSQQDGFSEEQTSGKEAQVYGSQAATEAKTDGRTEKDTRTTAVNASEKPLTAVTKQPATPTHQAVQNPQAFQDTLDAIDEGLQAKGQFQSRIMEQIVESVKTHFKPDDMKSEMVMKLKPESLGNVSLKVSIEKGVVLAEFQVDSQAVKQALESNLQDLRNALQDKGFNVFDLDVSVRKDNQNQPQTGSGRGQQNRTARIEGNLERMEQRLMSLEAIQRESTIDHLG